VWNHGKDRALAVLGSRHLPGEARPMSIVHCLATVVIPVFNSAATLRRAAESALRQSVWPLEVLIIDDASTDSSLEEARRIAEDDARVGVISLPKNHGKSFAMNHAIAEARGTWIAVLDADDKYADDRLATLIEAAERQDVDLVADNQYLFDAGAGQIVGTAFPLTGSSGTLDRNAFIGGADAFVEFNCGMLKPVIRADFVRRTGLRYRENARLSEDFLYLVEFYAAGGRAFLVSQPLYYWTQAFGEVSREWTNTGSGAWRYDFLAARTPNSDVRDGLSPSKDTDLIALLDRRDRALFLLHWMREFSRLRHSWRGIFQFLESISRHPSAWPFILRRVSRAAWRRVSPGRVDSAVT